MTMRDIKGPSKNQSSASRQAVQAAKIIHARHQYPVGHGGFHAAEVSWQAVKRPEFRRDFRYVYDCGALNKSKKRLYEHIDNYVRQYLDDGQLDIVFLSHIDHDHVSGLNKLLEKVKPRYIVMPLLNVFERLALVASYIDDPAVPQFVRNIAIDPVRWFSGKAENIVFVRSGGGGSEGPVLFGEGPVGDPPEDIGPWPVKFPDLSDESLPSDEGGDSSQVGSTTDRHPIAVMPGLWLFQPYIAKFESAELKTFKDRVESKLPDLAVMIKSAGSLAPMSSEAMRDVLKSDEERAVLRECYLKAFKKDQINRTSLCLYSGPLFETTWTTAANYFYRSNCNCIGWLGTGDAELGARPDLYRFHAHYKNHLSHLRTLMIPHHGSIHNYHPDIVSLMEPRRVFACCPQTSKDSHHPNPVVVADLAAKGYELQVVAEHDGGLPEWFELV